MTTATESNLLEKVLDAYWSAENNHLTISSKLRMRPVFRAIAEEIRTWAPPETQARICWLMTNEIADRLISESEVEA
jgi:hypothetical protein